MRQPTSHEPDGSWSVYLLRCADGTLYCGATNDLERRLAAHGRGRVKYTRGRLPVELALVERAGDKGAALSHEAALKRLTRRQKLARIAACAERGDGLRTTDALDELESRPVAGRRVRRKRR